MYVRAIPKCVWSDQDLVPVSQCQQPVTSLTQQLLDGEGQIPFLLTSGVRFLDIRCQVVKGDLLSEIGVRRPLRCLTDSLSRDAISTVYLASGSGSIVGFPDISPHRDRHSVVEG